MAFRQYVPSREEAATPEFLGKVFDGELPWWCEGCGCVMWFDKRFEPMSHVSNRTHQILDLQTQKNFEGVEPRDSAWSPPWVQ